MKEYSKGIYVKFKPEEVEILHNRMKEAGVQNMSAYIRKMALNGYVIIPKWPDLDQVISLHSRISNNLQRLRNALCWQIRLQGITFIRHSCSLINCMLK